ncbi:MAG: hypothetical protein V3T83_21320, partial [Acidobacteriota bacterium]
MMESLPDPVQDRVRSRRGSGGGAARKSGWGGGVGEAIAARRRVAPERGRRRVAWGENPRNRPEKR